MARLAALTPDDHERATLTWAHGPAPVAGPALAAEAFARSVRRAPAAVAVEHGTERLTYARLDAASDAVAARLTAAGHARAAVGVLLHPSPYLPVALLGVLKAGCCCVPLDPAHPAGRLASVLDDSRVTAVLTDRRTARSPAVARARAEVLLVEECRGGVRRGPAAVRVRPEDPAYLVHPAGSTGRPTGVLMPHRALAAVVARQVRRSGRLPLRTAQFAPWGQDTVFQEALSTWAAGGTLVLADREARRDPVRLLALLDAHRVERLFLPAPALRRLAECATAAGRRPAALREVVVGTGGRLEITPAVRAFFAGLPGGVLDHQYGPPETHVVTAGRLTGNPDRWPERVDIGRPVPGATVRILDEGLAPVPPGGLGELCVGGTGVALGYHRRPDATEERFVPDPFTAGRLLFRTGDRGRHLPDGRIDVVGRYGDRPAAPVNTARATDAARGTRTTGPNGATGTAGNTGTAGSTGTGQGTALGRRVEPGAIGTALNGVPGVAGAVVTAAAFPVLPALPAASDGPETGERRGRPASPRVPAGERLPEPAELRRTPRERPPQALASSLCVPPARPPRTEGGTVD
uniref:AMP-binding protein n=1 Tax=Streptomyces clavuligerus TaxID=1901 RepID=UPI0018D001BD